MSSTAAYGRLLAGVINQRRRELRQIAKDYVKDGFSIHDAVCLASDTVDPYGGEFWR